MNNKKSFIMYLDLCAVFDELTDEQAGQLIKQITNYADTKTKDNQKEPIRLFGLLNAVFTPFKNHIDRDFEAWEARAEIMRRNGQKGGRPKPEITKSNQNEAVKVNDNVNANVKVNVNDKVNVSNKDIIIPPHKNKKGVAIKPEGIEDQTWDDFIVLRKQKKAPLTETALKGIENEARRAGITLEQAIGYACYRGWAGFTAEWFKNAGANTSGYGTAGTANNTKRSQGAIAAEIGEQIIARRNAEWDAKHSKRQQGGAEPVNPLALSDILST